MKRRPPSDPPVSHDHEDGHGPERAWGVSRCQCGVYRVHMDRVTVTMTDSEFHRFAGLVAQAVDRVRTIQ